LIQAFRPYLPSQLQLLYVFRCSSSLDLLCNHTDKLPRFSSFLSCLPELIQGLSLAAARQEQVDLRALVELCALVLLFQPLLVPLFSHLAKNSKAGEFSSDENNQLKKPQWAPCYFNMTRLCISVILALYQSKESHRCQAKI